MVVSVLHLNKKILQLKKTSGSTVVYPYDNSSLPELELGASIFVEANQNLWRASDEFNLTRRDFLGESYETGIWDGQNILFSVRSAFASFYPSLIFVFSTTADGGIQPKCYGDMATCHPNGRKHCMKTLFIAQFFVIYSRTVFKT